MKLAFIYLEVHDHEIHIEEREVSNHEDKEDDVANVAKRGPRGEHARDFFFFEGKIS